MGGLFISANNSLLQEWTGPLADAIIPVWDASGNPWKISAANVLVGGDYALFPFSATGGATETVTGLSGKTVIAIFRGNDFACGATFDSGTAIATAPTGNDWLGGEQLNFLYKI